MLTCTDLSISSDTQPIVSDLSLAIRPGEIHALMGPNGSGKSTLAHTIAGNPLYSITGGQIQLGDHTITNLAPHERARLGLFVSFQQPPAIAGLKVSTLLKEAHRALYPHRFIETDAFWCQVEQYVALVGMDTSFLSRNCNDGFSGGERKRFELLQLLVLKPTYIILDEIDSGLDVDGLRLVARIITMLRAQDDQRSFLIISHYQRLFEHITPDQVHVLCKGKIVATGDASLLYQVNEKGYDAYKAPTTSSSL